MDLKKEPSQRDLTEGVVPPLIRLDVVCDQVPGPRRVDIVCRGDEAHAEVVHLCRFEPVVGEVHPPNSSTAAGGAVRGQ